MSSVGRKLLEKATRALVGVETLAPEVADKVQKLVSQTGRIQEGALGNRKLMGNLLVGHKGATGAIKARYAQGGLLGPGGVLLGELALDPKFKELAKAVASSKSGEQLLDPYTGRLISRRRALAKTLGKGATESINPAFLVGLPLLDTKHALDNPDYLEEGGASGVLGSLGNAAGFMAAAPLGLVGGIGGSMLGQSIGSFLGGLSDSKPPILGAQSSGNSKIPNAANLILDAAIPQ